MNGKAPKPLQVRCEHHPESGEICTSPVHSRPANRTASRLSSAFSQSCKDLFIKDYGVIFGRATSSASVDHSYSRVYDGSALNDMACNKPRNLFQQLPPKLIVAIGEHLQLGERIFMERVCHKFRVCLQEYKLSLITNCTTGRAKYSLEKDRFLFLLRQHERARLEKDSSWPPGRDPEPVVLCEHFTFSLNAFAKVCKVPGLRSRMPGRTT
jgi:hypothetical protein